jgi:hypothetical protein
VEPVSRHRVLSLRCAHDRWRPRTGDAGGDYCHHRRRPAGSAAGRSADNELAEQSAVRAITQQVFGGAQVLQLTEVEQPQPIPTEVLVRVHAAGVNSVDGIIRAGVLPLLGQPPFVLGWDVSGVVESVVPGVTRFRPGDEVFGMPFFPRPARRTPSTSPCPRASSPPSRSRSAMPRPQPCRWRA